MKPFCLVTGSSGFIAFHTIKLLIEQGFQVVGVDDHNDSTSVLLKEKRCQKLLSSYPDDFQFFLGNITDKDFLGSLFQRFHFDGIVNLAARAGVRRSVLSPEEYVQSNEIGFLNVLNCAKQYHVEHIVQASTSSLYEGEKMPFSEDLPCNHPISPYAVTKKASECQAYVYHYLHGLNITVLRFFTVYGPYGRPDMSIFRFIKWIYEDSPVSVTGDGTQTRDFTYVEDVAQAIFLAISKKIEGFQVFNVGNDNVYSLLDMIQILESLLDKKATTDFIDKNPSDIAHTRADITKIHKFLNWKPTTLLPLGLKNTVEWFMNEYSWVRNVTI